MSQGNQPAVGDYGVGDAPGLGIYRCVEVPEFVVHITDDGDTLPPCEQCDPNRKPTYHRVVDESSSVDSVSAQDRNSQSATSFAEVADEAVDADPLKRREPETNEPGERIEDYLG